MTAAEEGVLYIAVGAEYVSEAKESVRSLRAANPDRRVGLVVDEPTIEADSELREYFDDLVVADHAAGDLRDKAYNLHLSPYERTVYLDTDIHVTGEISEMFDVLDRFDVALGHAMYRRIITIPDVPVTFPEFNGGVICFRQSDAVEKFLDSWQAMYRRQVEKGRPDGEVVFKEFQTLEEIPNGRKHDQPPLREALYKSDLRIATLPSEYNFRGEGYAELPVRVLHSRHPRIKKFAAALNKYGVPRVSANWRNRIYFKNGNTVGAQKPLHYRISQLFARKGITEALRRIGLYPAAKRVYDALERRK
jgi:hypothetical protein